MMHMVKQPSKASTRVQLPMPAPQSVLQHKCACGGTPGVDGECASCRAKHLGMQRRATNQVGASTVPPILHDVLRSLGQPLNTQTRAVMEPRLGHDFSNVRVHTGAQADESARSVNALAYTVGRDVVFGAGQYAPGTTQGQRLLAHELVHVVQQQKVPTAEALQGKLVIGQLNDAYEQEADAQAANTMAGDKAKTIQVNNQLGVFRLQRTATPEEILKDTRCKVALSNPTSTDFSVPFTINSAVVPLDKLGAKPDESDPIAVFVNSMHGDTTSNVRVDGFASIDGPADFNLKLSCQRAEAVADKLIEKGIAASKISIFAHGATSQFSDKNLNKSLGKNRIVTINKTAGVLPPAPPTPPNPTPPTPSVCKPSPIDITKIPGVMDSKGWIQGATLLREWFADTARVGGSKLLSPVDDKTIKMDWVLGFSRAKAEYDAILKDKTYVNTAAQGEIAKLLKRLGKDKGGTFDFAKPVSDLDPDYDIQFAKVGSPFDDLDTMKAALGRFTIHAVIAGNVVKEASTGRFQVIVTDVGIHVRDSFDFEGWQPLGCWNVCTNEVGNVACGGGESVSNADFRDWRKTNGKGGDFRIVSDLKVTHLASPEVFYLP